MSIIVSVFNTQGDLPIATKSVKPLIKEVLSLEKRKTNEVAVFFVTTEEISRIHEDFFQDPSPTDCISFPLDQDENVGYHFLGEVYVCPKVAMDYVLQHIARPSQLDFYVETSLYLVHGLLHLFGYDDIEENDRKAMKRVEKKILEHLVKNDILLFG